jgi:rRNA maturation RNase YbeY
MINFTSVEVKYNLRNKLSLKKWIKLVLVQEGKKCGDITYVFCDDKYLGNMNEQYLKHDTLTDIITFDYSESGVVSGDIFISIERVKENAVSFNTGFNAELGRVMVHGILHLSGYKDKLASDNIIMRGKEDYYLAAFPNL